MHIALCDLQAAHLRQRQCSDPFSQAEDGDASGNHKGHKKAMLCHITGVCTVKSALVLHVLTVESSCRC